MMSITKFTVVLSSYNIVELLSLQIKFSKARTIFWLHLNQGFCIKIFHKNFEIVIHVNLWIFEPIRLNKLTDDQIWLDLNDVTLCKSQKLKPDFIRRPRRIEPHCANSKNYSNQTKCSISRVTSSIFQTLWFIRYEPYGMVHTVKAGKTSMCDTLPNEIQT